ncbi:MAG: zinc-dependent metalloprotease [Maricaulaceae bacterium]
MAHSFGPWRAVILALVIGMAFPLSAVSAADGPAAKDADPFAQAVDGLTAQAGLFDLYVDDATARVLAVLPRPDAQGEALTVIYTTGLTAGLGSNPVGLDRGAGGGSEILTFRRIGDRVIAEIENTRYRATAANPRERQAVAQSFAPSFIWSGDIVARDVDGRLLVDLSDFLTRDHWGIAAQIKARGQGGYSLSQDRSYPDASAALAFPDNVELDAFLTFDSADPGAEPNATAADARAVTLVLHHSFIRLPDDGYQVRRADQRSGVIEIGYYDFSAPLDAPIVTRLARRFRLERVDPAAESGPVKEPIVFYVDPGAPAQIRDALIEGASWWAEAFEAAGFEDAYRVEVLPEGAHPFDVRYNMIQWVHRQTRGWSYGGGVYDPRTGEMLKANVILGSQRVRQDRMIFEGLFGADKSGTGADDDPVEIALSRIRQLSAHEVGHTLGFAHNFAASANDRASVMDYPAPYIRPDGAGGLDASEAYDVGVGAWDIAATRWLYSQFPPGVDEAAALDGILEDAFASGLRFVADPEGRGPGTAHPHGSVWDNGADPVATLDEVMSVRRIALETFGLRSLRPGQPISDLQAVLAPIYLYHRYQTAAAAKLIGGLHFSYGLKGDGSTPAQPVAASVQRRALDAVLKTLTPAALDLPEALLNQLTPPINGGFGAGERFEAAAAPVFDLNAAADAAASLSLSVLLHPQRAARLEAFHARDPNALGLAELIDAVIRQVLAPAAHSRQAALAETVQTRLVQILTELALDEAAAAGVRAEANAGLERLRVRLARIAVTQNSAHAQWLVGQITAHQDRPAPAQPVSSPAPNIPPGSPIGAAGPAYETCWHCEGWGPAARW